jgi:hypothetical protein
LYQLRRNNKVRGLPARAEDCLQRKIDPRTNNTFILQLASNPVGRPRKAAERPIFVETTEPVYLSPGDLPVPFFCCSTDDCSLQRPFLIKSAN